MINVTAKNEYLFREPRLNRVIVLSELNYIWTRSDLKKLKIMREKMFAIKEMVYEFGRDPDEVLLALIHLVTCERKKFTPYVLILEHLNFLWDRHELRELKQIWEKGYSVKYAADYFGRDPDEILLAIMHLAREDKITARKRGLRGEKH